MLLPAFNVRSVERWEPVTRDLCRSLVASFAHEGRADAAAGYAQQIPVRVIAGMLGIPADMSDTFTDWVRGVLEIGLQNPEVRIKSRTAIINFFRPIRFENAATVGCLLCGCEGEDGEDEHDGNS